MRASLKGRRTPGAVTFMVSLSLAWGGCQAPDDDEGKVEVDGVPLAEGGAIEMQSAALTTVGSLAADAKVRSGSYANTNYGSSTTLQSDGDDAGTDYHSYLRFSVGNVGTISSAKLRLYVANGSAGPHTVKLVSDNSWSESGITWNNKPATGTTVGTIGQTTANTWVEVDITSVVAANKTVSLAIEPGSNDGLDLRSRNASSNKPQIVIEHGSSTATGIVADAKVRSGSYASTNYGSTTDLQSDSDDAGTAYHSYLRFTVGDVPSGSIVKLRLYVFNPSAGTHDIKAVSDNSRSESGITWNNKPAVGSTVATIGATAASGWVETDITSAVTANSTLSLAIVPNSTDGLDFNSRNASSNKPEILIQSGGGSNTISTDANLKVAFVGDTSDGTNWGNVLNLVKNEGAAAVVVAGDMTYDSDPNGWWSKTESVVGTSFPVFLARGNHDDSSWSGFLSKAANHLGGATRVNGSHDAAYKTLFRGLNIVAIKKYDTGSEISNLFGSDAHIWKVCQWHQNQNKMQVGGKGDEMGWDVYETCRQKGAIIITGHEHTYHRTKTMTNITSQIIDSTCSSGGTVCVGPGRTFVSVTGTGGTGLRGQVRCTPTESSPPYASLNTSDASCPIWASIYTTNQGAQYGAQFIVFNVDGNPKKALSYFKNISGQIIDQFTIYAD